ncbi:MAG TPA: glycerophosphoryl diester phosphodiesterase membrane domain-containing protein [bacterium]|jgi:hypothetical protein
MSIGYDEHGTPTGPIEIRPMELGDILDGTFKIYRAAPMVFLGIVSIFLLFPLLLQTYGASFNIGGRENSLEMIGNLGQVLVFTLSGAFLALILQPMAQAVIVQVVSEIVLGKSPGIMESIKKTGSKCWTVLGATMLLSLILGGGLVVAGVVTLGFGLLIAIPVFFYFLVRLAFFSQAIVLDNRGVMDSYQRSFNLTDKLFWRVFGITFVIGLIVGIISYAVSQMGVFMSIMLDKIPGVPNLTARVVYVILATAISCLVYPIQYIGYTLLYYDTRIRKEGFDLVILAMAMDPDYVPPEDYQGTFEPVDPMRLPAQYRESATPEQVEVERQAKQSDNENPYSGIQGFNRNE